VNECKPLVLGGDDEEAKQAEAVKWFRRAAAQGESHAQTLLGMALKDGRGVAEDEAEAAAMFRAAAEQGDTQVRCCTLTAVRKRETLPRV
jgi:TPR repeat protein